jgi:hypothetical protein
MLLLVSHFSKMSFFLKMLEASGISPNSLPETSKEKTSPLLYPLTCLSEMLGTRARFLYCYGNSAPEDLCLYAQPTTDELSLLLLGCGDLRNVLYTISEAKRKGLNCQLSFTMNDWRPEILARNAIILFALYNEADLNADHLSQFWYSLKMTREAYEFWMAIIDKCLSKSVDELPFDLRTSEESIRFVWKSWRNNFDWTLEELNRRRKACWNFHANRQNLPSLEGHFERTTDNFIQKLDVENARERKQLRKEFLKHTLSASLNDGPLVNPSLHLVQYDGSFSYCLHYGTSMFEGVHFVEELGFIGSMMAMLNKWIQDFRDMNSRVNFSFAPGHAVSALDDQLNLGAKFDVIETSNLADYVGHLNLLSPASALLKKDSQSFIRISSFHIFSSSVSRFAHLEDVLGLPIELCPTILGLELKEIAPDFWETYIDPFKPNAMRSTRTVQIREFEVFFWRKAKTPSLAVDLESSDFLTSTLVKMASKLCCSPSNQIMGPGNNFCIMKIYF